MQKAPILKGSGLKPLEETQSSEEVHVFGKNLEERVIAHKEDEKPAQISFVTSQHDQNPPENDIESIKKRKFDAITGEEDEETVFQGDFKLFVWEPESSNWMEKGRGQLKLNDSIEDKITKSRLIMRISGTLRIILNVAIKQSTFKIIATSKTNIRFTDSLTVWAVSGSNAQQLEYLIEQRLVKSSCDASDHETDDTTNDTDDEDATDDEPTKRSKPDPVVTEKTPEEAGPKESTSPNVRTENSEDSPKSEPAGAEYAPKEDDSESDSREEKNSGGDSHEENDPKENPHEEKKSEDSENEER